MTSLSNYSGDNEDNDDLPQMIPCMYCYTQWPQSCSRPPPTHTFTGDPRASPEVSCAVLSPLILSPVSWCARFCCTLQKSISQSCVSSDSPMVGLMATSSKRGYAIPTSVIPRAPGSLQQTIEDPYLHRRCSNTVLSQSLWGSLGSGVHMVCLSPVSVSGVNGI